MSSLPLTNTLPPTTTPAEGCPTPLAWHEVLSSFREQSTPWELDRGGYRLRGRSLGTGPALYLLNGMGGSHELYALLAWLLRDTFRCVLYDYPGHEIRTGRLPRISLTDLAADLYAVADLQGDSQFCLYGTSFGSLVGLRALTPCSQATHDSGTSHVSGRIVRAVFQGGFAYRRLSSPERWLIRFGGLLPIRLRHMPLRKVVQRQNHLAWFPPYDRTRWEFFLENVGEVPVAALCQRGGMIRDNDLRPALAGIRQPVLLIHGEGDGLVSNDCHHALQQGIPGARTEWLHSSGHIPYLTHPHRLAKLIKDFLLEESG